MAGFDEIKPLEPIWPARKPQDRRDPRKPPQRPESQPDSRTPSPDTPCDDDGPHIDEYA